VQKIKFVGVVVFEKKRFEAIVDGNAYERPWHKDRRRNSSVLKIILLEYKHMKCAKAKMNRTGY
jgi:hypothetical protein